MHNRSFVLLLFLLPAVFTNYACTKNKIVTITDNNATIVQVRFACGLACDATGFVVKTADNQLYSPVKLNAAFRIDQLPVKLRYTRTGKLPADFAAPSYEQIAIEYIEK